MSMAGKQTKPLNFNMSMELDRAAERAYMMDHVFKQEEKKFYTDTYHGVDLKQLRKDYLPFLEHINNNYDFSEMLSEILGELNVSHTGSGYGGRRAEKVTPALGLLDRRPVRCKQLESQGRCHPGGHRRREDTRRRGLVLSDQRQAGRPGALLVLRSGDQGALERSGQAHLQLRAERDAVSEMG